MNKKQLYQFEEDIVDIYKKGLLRSPIHLSGSVDGKLEDFLIKLFKKIKPNDWVFSTYRSHYHSLLKGVKPEWLKEWVLNNKSIHVMNKEHKIVTSAIVGGCLPIALGVARAIKINANNLKYPKEKIDGLITMFIPHVWVFVGDMTARTGEFKQCLDYADFYDLPVTFVIEDNGLSTDTPTQEVWQSNNAQHYGHLKRGLRRGKNRLMRIVYKRKYPHYGVGVFVDFDKALKQDGKF